MPIKKCPNCGLPVAGYPICPVCGTPVENDTPPYAEKIKFTNGIKNDAKTFRFGKLKLTVWEIIFILVCNLSFVCVVSNLIIGGKCWCHYPVFGMFTLYFLSFACASGSAKRFVTRYRNAVLTLNFLSGIFNIVCNAAGNRRFDWAFDYFIPINILVACTILLCALFFKSVSMRNILLSLLMLFCQNLTQFVLMLAGVTATEQLPRILASAAFSVNFITLVNLVFLYFVKYRNAIVEKFRFWE